MTAPLGYRVLSYFDLRWPLRSARGDEAALGLIGKLDPKRDLWPLAIYAAGMIGVIARQWYDGHQRGEPFDLHPSTFVLAVVVSAVTFPVIFHSLQVESKPGLQLFLALQNGFFWPAILNQVMPTT